MSFDSLPNEVVSTIFSHVYRKSRKEVGFGRFCLGSDKEQDSDLDMTWKKEDLLDPFLFPKAITAVSQRWKAISERLPFLWTRIVAFVDSSSTPLSEVQSYLALSKKLPLHVYVLRRPERYSDLDLEEWQRCREVISLLSPHFRRCQEIDFDVIYSSSLPSISIDFLGQASLLEALSLKCRTDDAIAPAIPDSHLTIDEPFTSPALKKLCVDGRNFAHACLALPSWIHSLRGNKLQLRIHNFTPSYSIPKDYDFTLYDFTLILKQLKVTQLSLSNVEFDSRMTPAPDFSLPFDNLELDNISDAFFDNFTTFIGQYIASVYISRCDIGVMCFEFSSGFLGLDRISAVGQIYEFLRDWSSMAMRVSNCPGFDDKALEILGYDTSLESFEIENCSNFSFQGVKKMVEKRNACVSKQSGFDQTIALYNLSIRGHIHALTLEEELWMRQNASLDKFVWMTKDIAY